MKRLLIVLIVLAGIATFPTLAGTPAKTELTAAGSFTNPKDGGVTWNFGGELLAPVGGEHFLLGPAVNLSDNDNATAVGAAAEFRIGKSGLFAGASFDYLLKDPDEGDRESASYRAGFIGGVGSSGLVKVYAQKVAYGRDKDVNDLSAVFAVGIRF